MVEDRRLSYYVLLSCFTIVFSITVELMKRNNIIVSLIKAVSFLVFLRRNILCLLEKCEHRESSLNKARDDFNTIMAGFKTKTALSKGISKKIYENAESFY